MLKLRRIFIHALPVLLMGAAYAPASAGNPTSGQPCHFLEQPETTAGIGNLSVSFPTSGTAQLNWSAGQTGGAANTAIIVVIDIVDFQKVASLVSTQNTATVSGLIPGRKYRFEVSSGAETIVIEDWMP